MSSPEMIVAPSHAYYLTKAKNTGVSLEKSAFDLIQSRLKAYKDKPFPKSPVSQPRIYSKNVRLTSNDADFDCE